MQKRDDTPKAETDGLCMEAITAHRLFGVTMKAYCLRTE